MFFGVSFFAVFVFGVFAALNIISVSEMVRRTKNTRQGFFLWLGWLKGKYCLVKVMHFFSSFYECKNRSLEFLKREVSHWLPLLGNFTTGQESRTTWWTVEEFLSSPLLRHRYVTWFEVGFCNLSLTFCRVWSSGKKAFRNARKSHPINQSHVCTLLGFLGTNGSTKKQTWTDTTQRPTI